MEHRLRVVAAAGGGYRWFLSRAVPARDEAGRIIKWFGTATDIQANKEAEAALKAADQRRTEFLAMLGHELRNPLAPIANAVEVLRLAGPTDGAVRDGVDIIERQARHLVRLVDDLLDLSRIDRGKLVLRRTRVTLAEVVDQALEAIRPEVDKARQSLEVDLPPEPLYLDADPVRLAQVVLNLTSNASRYTGEGGHIRVSGRREGAEVVVRVSDDGVGIAPEHLGALFSMFYQVRTTPDRPQGGLGIGLAHTRSLVELHGGRVGAHSEGPGKGSEFSVWLPLPPQAPAPAAPEGRGEPGGGRRVLVADDERDGAESLAVFLRLHGHQVETAFDGQEAVAAAERERPDVILLDIGMPVLDGYAACRRIREQPWSKGMRIIALTGWGHDEDRRRTAEAGFDDHLVKPVEPRRLIELLSQPLPDPA
jgi:signal transduction histidine kinase